jgi:hypothetical protein
MVKAELTVRCAVMEKATYRSGNPSARGSLLSAKGGAENGTDAEMFADTCAEHDADVYAELRAAPFAKLRAVRFAEKGTDAKVIQILVQIVVQ